MGSHISVKNSANGIRIRQKAFDVLKSFAIFLVIWGHVIQYFLSSDYYEEPLYRIIYSFHMPLFMMISGYFSLSSMSLSPLSFLKKKFIQLILPAYSWIFVLALIHLFSKTHFSTVSPSLWIIYIEEAVVYIRDGFFEADPFWFLKTCFFCYLLAYSGSQLRLNKYVWMMITLIISQCELPFVNISHIDMMYPCFIVGMELKDNPQFFYQICRHYIWPLGLFLVMLIFWDQYFWGYDGFLNTLLTSRMHINDPLFLKIFTQLYKLAIGLAGSFAFIGLFCSIIPQDNTNKFVSLCGDWGQYTLGIYILQSIILEMYLSRYILLDGLNFYIYNFLVAPIIALLVLTICVNFIKKMMKSSGLAFFFLGKTKRAKSSS